MPNTPPVIRNLVPMLHVADVGQAIAFYARLGFVVAHTHHEPEVSASPVWAWLQSAGGADLMLALGERPIAPSAQRTLLHCYCDDVEEMHAQLESAGVDVGEIETPFYCPTGEFRVADPDGYCLMITSS